MASPETVAPSGALDSGGVEELFAPEGWKKKLILRKGGTQKRKDMVYVAPDGEEIKSKRQLDRYLKAHPGGANASEFDWSTGEVPRRSARLSSKTRLSSDSMEAEPATKRSKPEEDEDAKEVRTPDNTAREGKVSRRKGRHTPAAIPGKEEVMQEAEKVVDPGIPAAGMTIASEEALELNERTLKSVEGNAGGEDKEILLDETVPNETVDEVMKEESKVEDTVLKVEEVAEDLVEKQPPSAQLSVEATVESESAPEKLESVTEPDAGSGDKEMRESVEDGTPKKVDVCETEEDTANEIKSSALEVETPLAGGIVKDEVLSKPKEYIEAQGIHALIEEPVLPHTERVGVST